MIHALDRFGHWLTFYTPVVSFAFFPVRSPTRAISPGEKNDNDDDNDDDDNEEMGGWADE